MKFIGGKFSARNKYDSPFHHPDHLRLFMYLFYYYCLLVTIWSALRLLTCAIQPIFPTALKLQIQNATASCLFSWLIFFVCFNKNYLFIL